MKKALLLCLAAAPFAPAATIITSADSFIQSGAANVDTNFGISGSLTIKDSGNGTTTRKAYLLFDLSTVTGTISSASLRLTVAQNEIASSGGGTGAKIIDIFAPTDLAATFTESGAGGITWGNAPNNDTADTMDNNNFTASTTLINNQTVALSEVPGIIVDFSSAALVAYLNSEIAIGNKEALLMIRRDGDPSGNNFAFHSKDSGSVNGTTIIAPTLEYTIVPEPSAAVLGALGALALLRRRRN